MKATGIVRRIDDLGRVVIPKEIRRTMRIREGEALEIFTSDNGEVVFKKYSPVGETAEAAARLCESIWRTTSVPVVVCDRDRIIAAAGTGRRELLERSVSPELDRAMSDRKAYRMGGTTRISVSGERPGYYVLAAMPIISDGDVTGCVAFVGDENARLQGETEIKLAGAAAAFLGRQTEV
ncbi:MAG: AbrB/MazE/SpoVT family DNA-binding domain-containing protein [Clostridia bacterium]|nr:AbrB/MazE/SpoVT family DNA-binding domain-containing protein [Clostridia bacterium]